jgi:hypothetical protein
MAEGIINEAEQIITLVPTDTITRARMAVTHIILTSTAAGSFVLELGNTAMTVTTGTGDLTKMLPVDRTLNYAKLTSGPVGATMYIFLEQKR